MASDTKEGLRELVPELKQLISAWSSKRSYVKVADRTRTTEILRLAPHLLNSPVDVYIPNTPYIHGSRRRQIISYLEDMLRAINGMEEDVRSSNALDSISDRLHEMQLSRTEWDPEKLQQVVAIIASLTASIIMRRQREREQRPDPFEKLVSPESGIRREVKSEIQSAIPGVITFVEPLYKDKKLRLHYDASSCSDINKLKEVLSRLDVNGITLGPYLEFKGGARLIEACLDTSSRLPID